MRTLVSLLLLALVATALVIYEVKYDTRGLETRVQELQTAIQEERDAIAVLRAEWSLLNRPERVERLARKHLGLEPLAAQRMIAVEDLEKSAAKPMAQSGTGPAPPALSRKQSVVSH